MFTHVNPENQPHMVPVGEKAPTRRTARARALVVLTPEIMAQLRDGEIHSRKGPVFHTAILAGIMAAKRTAELIPLCHTLPLEDCAVTIEPAGADRVRVECRVSATHKTGVEMEALTGASVAALTLYDMCKAFTHGLRIERVELVEKTGGKRDFRAADA